MSKNHDVGSDRRFGTTRWSLVVAAGDSRNPDYRIALEELCSAYWHPVYAFIRRSGRDPDAAQDLVQGFFAQLLEKQTLKAADRERGRFRSFVLAALKFFLSNEQQRGRAQKRGGGQMPIALDAGTAEKHYNLEPAEGQTPETLFERRWALALLERALDRLREHLKRSANPERSLRLMGCLTSDDGRGHYKQLAAELEMSESAVKVGVHRMRRRFGDLLREEVAHTVEGPDGVEEEIRHLFRMIEGS